MRSWQLPFALLLLVFSSAGLRAEKTVFYANGVWNDEFARLRNLAYLKLAVQSALYPTTSPRSQQITGVRFRQLENPTEGTWEDVEEALLQIFEWDETDREVFFQLYHRGEVDGFLASMWTPPWVYTTFSYSDVEEMFRVLARVIRDIEDGARDGPSVVVAHSQGSLYAEQAFSIVDPSLRDRVRLAYVGSPWTQDQVAANPAVVSATCDPVALLQPEIATFSAVDADCHAFESYAKGRYSFETKSVLIDSVLQGLGLGEPEEVAVDAVRFGYPLDGASDQLLDFGLEIRVDVACENGEMLGEPPLLDRRLVRRNGGWELERLVALVSGESVDMVPVTMSIDTCSPSGGEAPALTVERAVRELDRETRLSLRSRERDTGHGLRVGFCKPDLAESFGLQRFVVRQSEGGAALCSGLLDFGGDPPTPREGDFQVNQRAAGYQEEPDVAVLPGGGFVSVWRGPTVGDPSFDAAIHLRLFDRYGLPVTDDIRVSGDPSTASRQSPRVSTNASGLVLVVWVDQTSSSPPSVRSNIKGRWYTPAGDALTAEFLVNELTQGPSPNHPTGAVGPNDFVQRSPDVAVHDSGSAAVVWQSFVTNGFDFDGESIQLRMISSGNLPVDHDIQVNAEIGGNQIVPSITATSDGYAVSWAHQPGLIRARTYSESGSATSAELRGIGSITHPDVASGADGSFVVGWLGGADVQFQRFGANGTVIGATVDAGLGIGGVAPSIAVDDLGNVVAVGAGVHSGSDNDVVFRRFLADGTPAGPELVANENTAGQQRAPSVGVYPNGNFVIVWESTTSMEDDQDGTSIQARFFRAP